MIQLSGGSRIRCTAGMLTGLLAASAACRHQEPDPLGYPRDVRFTAYAVVADGADTLLLRIQAVNRAREPKAVEIHHCEMSLALKLVSGRGKTARGWDRSAWLQSQPGGDDVVCVTFAIVAELSPGDSVDTYRTAVPVRTVLGDSLPPGRYRAYLGADAKLKGGLVTPNFELR